MARKLKLLTRITFWLSGVFIGTTALMVLMLRWVDPPSSAVIFAWELGSGQEARHEWQPLEKVSPNLQMAVIAAEDQKFAHHFGFDFASLKKAISEDRKRPRGASTITQQTAKNLFLWQGRSYVRKGLEAWFTILMEVLWPKERILEVYLNIAEFGDGVYGAQAAANQFFGTSARYLSSWQAGRMAAVLPNPKRMSAQYPSHYVRSRAVTINRQVRQLGGSAYLGTL